MSAVTTASDVKSTERQLWLDALRGVAMILVVYGHCVGGNNGWSEYFVFTSPVKMPLFFAISGYLFNPRNGDQVKFFKNLFWKIIVPWFVLGMFPYTHPVEQFFNLLSGKVLWFMPCLIIAEVLWFHIHKFAKKTVHIVALGLLTCIVGFAMHNFQVLRYAMTDTAFIVQAFFVLGLIIRRNEETLRRQRSVVIPICVLVFIVCGVVNLLVWPGQSLDVHMNRYFNIPFCAFEIVIGCTTLFVLFKKLNLSPKWLVYIGQNTLLIYILHSFGMSIFSKLSSYALQLQCLPIHVYGLLNASFAIGICCGLAVFVNKFIPVVVGKKRI